MKIWAIVIGTKGRHTRYVCYEPTGGDNQNGALEVYATIKHAKEAKTRALETCGHKDVYIIPFENDCD